LRSSRSRRLRNHPTLSRVEPTRYNSLCEGASCPTGPLFSSPLFWSSLVASSIGYRRYVGTTRTRSGTERRSRSIHYPTGNNSDAVATHSCSLISWASNAEVVYSLLNSLTVIACRVATPRTPCWLRRLIAKSQGCEDDADCKGHHWLSPRIVRHSRRLFESEDMFPIVLHADHYRAVFHCLIVKLLGKAFGDSDVS
jgi:hypothetical protein